MKTWMLALLALGPLHLAASPNCPIEPADGAEKAFVRDLTSPLLGGQQTSGLLKDRRYKMASAAIEKLTSGSHDILRGSVLTLNALGNWGYYKGFCEGSLSESCIDFLPDEKLIQNQSPLMGSASMLLLWQAYSSVDGPQREKIANRIRGIYQNTPESEVLKSKRIKQIYREIFNIQLSRLMA